MEPEDILDVLQSISDVDIVDGELEVQFYDCESPSTASEFVNGSFTRDLFELIEHHLQEDNDG